MHPTTTVSAMTTYTITLYADDLMRPYARDYNDMGHNYLQQWRSSSALSSAMLMTEETRVMADECVVGRGGGHNYMCHNYIGHNYTGHNHIGNNCIGHSYIGHDYSHAITTYAIAI